MHRIMRLHVHLHLPYPVFLIVKAASTLDRPAPY